MPVTITLDQIREKMISLEDGVIMSFFNRALYKRNEKAYIPGEVKIKNFSGSLFEFSFLQIERGYSVLGRYLNGEEYSFFPLTAESEVFRKVEDLGIEKSINVNPLILNDYLDCLKNICKPGDDNQYGSAIEWDALCLQFLSKRIHLGKQVAEAKYQENPVEYQRMINAKDEAGLMTKLTNLKVEDNVLLRVNQKGERYNINSQFISDFYRAKIIPLTKEVEVRYLLIRK